MATRIIFAIISHVVILESAGQSKSSAGSSSDTSGAKTIDSDADGISTTAGNVAVKQSAAQSTSTTGKDSGPSGAKSSASSGNLGGKTADSAAVKDSAAQSTSATGTRSDSSGAKTSASSGSFINTTAVNVAVGTTADKTNSDASGAKGTSGSKTAEGGVSGNSCGGRMPRQPCVLEGHGPAELWLSPKWTSTESWKDKEGTLSGAFAVEMMWQQPACEGIGLQGDYRDMITAANFAGGSSGRVKSAVVFFGPRWNSVHRGSVTYVGAWHQLSDGSCYPFDVVKMTFNMTIPVPFSKGFKPKLFCNADDAAMCTAYSVDGTPVCREAAGVKVIQKNTDGILAKGFRLSSLTCEVTEARSGASMHEILCSMTCTREDPKRFYLEVVPGLIMLIIGYGSFLIPPKLAMPRVATCMIALLTFVGKGTAVLSGLPSKGFSLVEFFYLFGMASMLVNMVGHIVAFRYPHLSYFVDTLSLQVSFCSTLLVLVLFLLSRDCSNIDRSYILALLAISALMLVASFFLAVWRFKSVLKAKITSFRSQLLVKQMEDEELQESVVLERDDEQTRRADGERELQQRRPALPITGEESMTI